MNRSIDWNMFALSPTAGSNSPTWRNSVDENESPNVIHAGPSLRCGSASEWHSAGLPVRCSTVVFAD